ncbi:MAG: hypothetical protein P9M13_04250 [Candidatus Ancaeobacter aquaticus]|nr:hypothetical protein [Candidatus Ancaeobacter aquaticus]
MLLIYIGIAFGKVIGKRPGELFGCVHATEMPAGCGTSVFCTECGAVKSIISAQNGKVWFESREGKGTTFFVELKDLK